MGILDGYQFDPQTYSGGNGILGMLAQQFGLPQPGQQPQGFPDQLPQNAAPAIGAMQPQPQPQQAPDQNPLAALFGGISNGISGLFSGGPGAAMAAAPGAGQQLGGPPPPAAASPGMFDRLQAGANNLSSGGNPIAALLNGIGGLASGQRTDAQGIALQQQAATYQALVQAGVPPAVAHSAVLNPEVLKTIAPQLYSKPEFKTIKNALGEDIPIFANADKQTITYPTANGGQGAGGADIGGMQKTFDQIEAARNSGASTDQLLQNIPNSLREGVRAMLSGGAVPSNLSNRGAARDLTLRFAHAIDPSFDESLIPARVALQKSYQGGGKNYQETLALNTVGGHLSRLADAADGLGNTDFKPWNRLKNQTTSALTGNPALVKFRNDLVTTQNELAKAYHGGHVSDSAFNAFNNSINEAQTPAELKTAIGELAGLLGSKIQANESGYKTGMNGLPLPSQYRAINDEAKHSFDKIGKWVGGEQAQQQGSPKISEGAIATNPQTGQKIQFKGGKWVPMQ
jgi:hypothetical protein